MTEKNITRFRKGDAVTIALVIAAALGMIAAFTMSLDGGGERKAQIWQNGELVQELPLRTDAEMVVEGEWRNTITIRDGKVAITESNCPGLDCVHTGWVSSGGRSLVCLPNRVEVRIVSDSEDEVDAVVR